MIAPVPKLARLARDYPDVVLDVTTDNSRVDLVAAGFDAGIEIGEFIQKDGPLIVDDAEISVRAALVGIGVVWTLEHYAAPFISAGKLVRVLEGWCPPFQATFSAIRADDSNPPCFQR